MTESVGDYVFPTDRSIDVVQLLREGRHPLCPRCRARLIVALTPDDAKRLGINPGMQCPVSPRHFQSTAYFR